MAKFTIEDKIKAVKRYLVDREPLLGIAKQIGVHKSILQYWVRKYQYHGEKAFSKDNLYMTLKKLFRHDIDTF
ncbi:transposase [Bacillus altitudinis]